MCGRYTLTNSTNLEQRFRVSQAVLPLGARYNVAPTQEMPVVVQAQEGGNRLEIMKWGLIPFWSKEPKAGYSTINARAEGLESKPAYRKPVRSQRCIVPADGFYEWQKSNGSKVPFFIHLKGGEVFGMAGLYDLYKLPDGDWLKTYTIVTTEANELMQQVHDRMPVILPKEAEDEWLDRSVTDPFQVIRWLKPYPAEEMELYPVSKQVNSPSNDLPELVKTINSA